jgi:hypothetical protein
MREGEGTQEAQEAEEEGDSSSASCASCVPFLYSKISGQENVITVFIMPLGGRTL